MEENDGPRFTFALQRGAVLGGRYRIDRLLADSSSFALTYLATDLSTADEAVKSLAIKEFLPRVLVGRARNGYTAQPHSPANEREFARALRRFLDEAEVLHGIESPNLVRVHGCFEENGTGYVVMAPRLGRPLPAALAEAKAGCIGSTEATALVVRLLRVLEQLHAKGVVHRGISPEAVWVTDTWEPILHGFSARRHVSAGAPETIPGFTAFEQYAAGDVGPWTDVYACAALLYHLLAGGPPTAAVMRATGKPLAPVGWLAPWVSPTLSQAISLGLTLMPEQRPHSATEFRSLLQETAVTVAIPDLEPALLVDTSRPTADTEVEPEVELEVEPEASADPAPYVGGVVAVPDEIDDHRETRARGRLADRLREALGRGSATLRFPKAAVVAARIGALRPSARRYLRVAGLTVAVTGSAYVLLAHRLDAELRAASDGAVQIDAATSSAARRLSAAARARDTAGLNHEGDTMAPEPRAAGAPTPGEAASLPKMKGMKVAVAIDAEKKLVPVDVVVGLQTQLSSGKDQVDQGQYVLARRIFASALAAADAGINTFPGSETLRSIRAQLDSADRNAVRACQAENDVIRKRGGKAASCD